MLGRMLIHGLVGAAVIASAAAVFAQANDSAVPMPDAAPAVADKTTPADGLRTENASKDNGYLIDRRQDRERGKKHEHRREGRHHDDDDD